jgi:hypothetical protein
MVGNCEIERSRSTEMTITRHNGSRKIRLFVTISSGQHNLRVFDNLLSRDLHLD